MNPSGLHIELPTEANQQVMAAWEKFSRLEERTCRPIVNGKRIPPNPEVITWIFMMDGLEEPVGRFSYFDVNPRNRSAEIGYMVNPQLRNQGIGSQILRIAINQLFVTTALNKLYCQTGSFNTPSIRLLEKLGFRQEGVLREHHELDGRLWDDYIYSVLRREWEMKEGT
jgi:RimJ/RimL family protein N-acetyltransferase